MRKGSHVQVMQFDVCLGFVRGQRSTLKSRIASAAANGIAIMLCVGLAACAEDRNYPSLSKISDLGSILTPQERQKAVEDLQKQAQVHSNNP
jgi:hypothetical protein